MRTSSAPCRSRRPSLYATLAACQVGAGSCTMTRRHSPGSESSLLSPRVLIHHSSPPVLLAALAAVPEPSMAGCTAVPA